MKKYLQLKLVTAAKQLTSAHAGPRMSAKVSGGTSASCQANTAANTATAKQTGDSTYASASASQSFTVAPAVLTVDAKNVTRVNNVQNPPLTGYSLTGFVSGTSAVVGGAPVMTTTAQPGSPVGTYPITIAQGTLSAANYTFAFVNGTLTITAGGPAQRGVAFCNESAGAMAPNFLGRCGPKKRSGDIFTGLL